MAWTVATDGTIEGTIGDTLGVRFRATVIDEDDAALDMRGHTWECEIRRRRSSVSPIVEGTLVSDDSTATELSLWFELATDDLPPGVTVLLGLVATAGTYADPQWTVVEALPVVGRLGAAREGSP
jgi:hypothetical protein